jgi:hypothetical protein
MVFNRRAAVLCSSDKCLCLCKGKEEGITGYGKKPCFSPGSHTSCPKLTLSDEITFCSRGRGEKGGGEGGGGGGRGAIDIRRLTYSTWQT